MVSQVSFPRVVRATTVDGRVVPAPRKRTWSVEVSEGVCIDSLFSACADAVAAHAELVGWGDAAAAEVQAPAREAVAAEPEADRFAADELENWQAKAARRARVTAPAAAPSVGRMALLTTRCVVQSRPSPAEGVRMVALAALAYLSARESSPASRLWVGHMRAAFRRAMAARAAVEAAIQPTPWLDLLGSHAITSAAVLGLVAGIVTYLTVR